MTDNAYLDMGKPEFASLRRKLKTAIYIIGGDFNPQDIYRLEKHNFTFSHYSHRVSKAFLDITMDLSLEQAVNLQTRLQNTLDHVCMSHPSFKIRCKPLPPIGLKCDHDIVLLGTSTQPIRTRLPRRKILILKKANRMNHSTSTDFYWPILHRFYKMHWRYSRISISRSWRDYFYKFILPEVQINLHFG